MTITLSTNTKRKFSFWEHLSGASSIMLMLLAIYYLTIGDNFGKAAFFLVSFQLGTLISILSDISQRLIIIGRPE